jgi:hypothetical protein
MNLDFDAHSRARIWARIRIRHGSGWTLSKKPASDLSWRRLLVTLELLHHHQLSIIWKPNEIFSSVRPAEIIFALHFEIRYYTSCPKQILVAVPKKILNLRNEKLQADLTTTFQLIQCNCSASAMIVILSELPRFFVQTFPFNSWVTLLHKLRSF